MKEYILYVYDDNDERVFLERFQGTLNEVTERAYILNKELVSIYDGEVLVLDLEDTYYD